MKLTNLFKGALAAFLPAAPAAPARLVEAAGATSLAEDDTGWTRLSGTSVPGTGLRDLTPMSQDHMHRVAEFLWQSNVLANRLIELPLGYLLAEGVKLQCKDEAHQKVLDAFWLDPINNWPLKLYSRARDLSLLGEQCYRVFANEHSGAVRLGYVDPRTIGRVVMDPDNPEQAIGVITKKDMQGRYQKYRVVVMGDDAELFSARTVEIRASFTDGDVFLFQINNLATGSRGRSDLLAQADWLDEYDGFLFGELDRAGYLRSFVWDLNIKNASPDDIKRRAAEFKPPAPNTAYVHNDGEELEPKQPELQAADSDSFARLFRNHILAGATIPEHWAGGGGDVNRAAASEMGEPTFKMLTARQSLLKLMLETIGRYVLSRQPSVTPDWGDPKWQVTAVFPELVSKDVTKFASALREITAAVLMLVDKGLLTEERALGLVADVAARFGQEVDAKEEIGKAREEHRQRQADQANQDTFTTPDGTDPNALNPGNQPKPGGAAGA